MFKEGDEFTIEGASLKIETGKAVCIHSLPTLLHFSMALREGADPVELGLAKEGNKAYLRCPDPGEPYTNGGGVIFEIERVD
ncbi:MAG: TIGR04076 family protein [Methanomassiliicoccales archaeon]|nr:MAG: TIGR04076 family protein [Methanomassiliicoccales archaeon]